MPRTFDGVLTNWNSSAIIDQTNKMILFYGDPNIQDASDNTQSAWTTVKTWAGFQNPGSLTSINTSFIDSLASGISSGYQNAALTR
jgi:hypothetical protein